MNILERLLGHDAWTTRQLLLRCRELSDEQLDRSFDIGDRSVRETFHHVIAVMESHTDFLLGQTDTDRSREEETLNGMLMRLTVVSKDLGVFHLS